MEITTALKDCLKSLAPLKVDIEPLPPIRKDACGVAAPVLLRSLGRTQKVIVQPPAIINCRMVAALDRWLEDGVQPAARASFGSPVARIIGSSYACRNIYNREDDRLSQHAIGNAFDLPSFVLANGRRIHVVLGWGPTSRDESPRLVPVVAKTAKGSPDSETPENKRAQPKKAVDATEAKFLRRVHREACAVFSTVLGPEANDVHRDHFHLDLQDRASHTVCQ